ncbi:MAG: substrate-binding domain-containing protein [Williamsia sp.]|nr:substrate-binding domain-containing protein [Williamsia sp.]
MRKVLLKNIAEHVGVSIALVSYVLNGKAEEKQVGKEAAEKIRAAAAELNYQPNHIAKSLKTRKTYTIGLVVADIKYRFSTGITSAIEAEAKKKGYNVIFGSSNENAEKFNELTNVLVNRQVDGLIVVPSEDSQDQIALLQNSGVPLVLIDRYFPELNTNCIVLDNFKAAYEITSYLIRQGHARIGFVNLETTLHHLHERSRGYKQALADHGIEFSPHWLQKIGVNDRAKGVETALNQMLKREAPCDAVFFATDTLSIMGLKTMNGMNLKVPDDVSVISFDEAEAFDLFYCSVTHWRQPLEEMGKIAVKTLIDVIKHGKTYKQITLESSFVAGKSCRE